MSLARAATGGNGCITAAVGGWRAEARLDRLLLETSAASRPSTARPAFRRLDVGEGGSHISLRHQSGSGMREATEARLAAGTRASSSRAPSVLAQALSNTRPPLESGGWGGHPDR